jgi:hypothetical protein
MNNLPMSDQRDITTPGRDLPVLANIQQQQQTHIPDIHGLRSSSPASSSNARMNPMLLNTRDGLNAINNVKGEEPKSPQPSSFVPDKKDEDMPDVKEESSRTEENEDEEMENADTQ